MADRRRGWSKRSVDLSRKRVGVGDSDEGQAGRCEPGVRIRNAA